MFVFWETLGFFGFRASGTLKNSSANAPRGIAMPWPIGHNGIYLCDQGDVDQFLGDVMADSNITVNAS